MHLTAMEDAARKGGSNNHVCTSEYLHHLCRHFTCDLILFTVPELYCLVQIRPIQFTLNYVQESSMVYTIFFWSRFYYSIIKIKEKCRSLWEILKNPVSPNGPKSDKTVVTVWQQGGPDHLMRNKLYAYIKICTVTPTIRYKERTRTSTKRHVRILMKH